MCEYYIIFTRTITSCPVLNACMCVCIYVYVFVLYICICVYTYIVVCIENWKICEHIYIYNINPVFTRIDMH